MRRAFLLVAIAALVCQAACQKQQSEAERQAEIERQVQERLAAEHQKEQAQQLAQREADLNARETALREQEKSASPAAALPGLGAAAPEPPAAPDTYSLFYDQLEPYGDWIDSADYGFVYRPREAASSRWRPYTNGHWVYTDAGWTWISDEPFGWATYHYGRWTRLRGVGWVWVPGDQWAPAWVSWRKGGDYVGWAPLPPEAQFEAGRGIQQWSDNYYGVGPDQYLFVATEQFGDERLEHAIVPEQRNITIVNETTNITNITFNNLFIVNQGPSYDELRRRSRQPIPRLRLERRPGNEGGAFRSVVRGDVVEMPAPSIAPRRTERPRIVKGTIPQTAVDLGWAGAGNSLELERARNKMRAESTPPANAPSKILGKDEATNSVRTVPPVVTPTAPAATPLPTAMRRGNLAPEPDASPLPRFTPFRGAVPTVAPRTSASVPGQASPRMDAGAPIFSPPRRRLVPPPNGLPASETPAASAPATPPRWRNSAARQFAPPNPTIPLDSPAQRAGRPRVTPTPASP